MSDVPSSDWGNDFSLMSANLPERSLSYRQRIPRTSRAHRAQLLPAICATSAHHMRDMRPNSYPLFTTMRPTICAPYAQLLPTIFFTFVQLFSFFTLTITYTPL